MSRVETIIMNETEKACGSLPILGLTMGDPCGIGPEVLVKALNCPEVYRVCRPFVIGHPGILSDYFKFLDLNLDIRLVKSPEEGVYKFGGVDILSPKDLEISQIQVGSVCKEAGLAAVLWVIEAIDLAMSGKIDGIVTGPINKTAINLAGYHYPGHTELLADRTGTDQVRLMLASERLNVAHVTGHLPLSEVPSKLTPDLVYSTIVLMQKVLEDLGFKDPRIAVCGLNPHAGESGIFGSEDEDLIWPAVKMAQNENRKVTGPLPGDTTFIKAHEGVFDGVVAMYHDQGHGPVKLIAFHEAVNVTLGLPIVRTSVDHGTAFDIAGKGLAKEKNMICAIMMGARLSEGRRSK